MDFKKGANAYGLSFCLIIVGSLFLLVNLLIGQFAEATPLARFFSFEFESMGQIALWFGLIGLAFTIPGAFFSLNTDGWIIKVFMLIVGQAVITMLYLMVIIIGGFSLIDQPVLGQIFQVLVGIAGFLFFSTFFLHAARKRDDPDLFSRALAAAIRTGKVVMFGNKSQHRVH